MEHWSGVRNAAVTLAIAAAGLSEPERAACLWFAALPLGADLTGAQCADHEAIMDGVRRQLGEARWAELEAKGRTMTSRQLAAYALGEE
jgi:hypothetical protein